VTVHIGTSGWQYRDWRGVLYPDRCPQAKWLGEYATEFQTVESNNAFYRLPEKELFARWRDATPEGFVMAVKASRYLTHIKRLKDPAEPVHRLMERVEGLGPKLGPILLQLPPTLRADQDLLDQTLRQFPRSTRVAVEFRHPSWWTDDTRRTLEQHRSTLTWTDRGSRRQTPLWRTADWGYVRLHEGRATPKPRYGRQALRSWADRITRGFTLHEDVYVYLNNDPNGAAVQDARALRDLLGSRTSRDD
jgi:uncharacterized protein YecE (DUF72 family)